MPRCEIRVSSRKRTDLPHHPELPTCIYFPKELGTFYEELTVNDVVGLESVLALTLVPRLIKTL